MKPANLTKLKTFAQKFIAEIPIETHLPQLPEIIGFFDLFLPNFLLLFEFCILHVRRSHSLYIDKQTHNDQL